MPNFAIKTKVAIKYPYACGINAIQNPPRADKAKLSIRESRGPRALYKNPEIINAVISLKQPIVKFT
jgi:hypothetical protein